MKKRFQKTLHFRRKKISNFQMHHQKLQQPERIVGGLMDSCTWICDDDVL